MAQTDHSAERPRIIRPDSTLSKPQQVPIDGDQVEVEPGVFKLRMNACMMGIGVDTLDVIADAIADRVLLKLEQRTLAEAEQRGEKPGAGPGQDGIDGNGETIGEYKPPGSETYVMQ